MQSQRSIPIGSDCNNIFNARTNHTNLRWNYNFRFRGIGIDSHYAIHTIICSNDIGMGSGLKMLFRSYFEIEILTTKFSYTGGPNIATEGRTHFQQFVHFQYVVLDIQTVHQGEIEEEG